MSKIREWHAAISVEVPAGIRPDELSRKLHTFAEALGALPYAQFETETPVALKDNAFLRAEIVVRAVDDRDASAQAAQAAESAADAAGLPITAARVVNVY